MISSRSRGLHWLTPAAGMPLCSTPTQLSSTPAALLARPSAQAGGRESLPACRGGVLGRHNDAEKLTLWPPPSRETAPALHLSYLPIILANLLTAS